MYLHRASANIILGSTGVFIGGKPAARVGDLTAHGGTITGPGCLTVLIGETMAAPTTTLSAAAWDLDSDARQKVEQVLALRNAAQKGVAFCEECNRRKEQQT